MGRYVLEDLRVLTYYIRRALNAGANQLDLTNIQMAILNFVALRNYEHIDTCQKAVEDAFNISKSSMSDSLQSLENKGLIVRSICQDGDSRRKMITLTEKGMKTNEKSFKFLEEVNEKVLSPLDENEIKTLSDILDKLIKNLGGQKI